MSIQGSMSELPSHHVHGRLCVPNHPSPANCSQSAAETCTGGFIEYVMRLQVRMFQTSACIAYHMHTIWLFTRSDLKTIVWPSAFFASVVAMSRPAFSPCFESTYTVTFVKRDLIRTIFWLWINLLPFSIQNQVQPDSMAEDLQNKPWRPLPSKRVSAKSARRLMWTSYTAAFFTSIVLGGWLQCVSLLGLGYWYNEMGGADASYIIRNFINGCGYMCFTSGAAEIMLNRSITSFNTAGWEWLLIIGAMIITTIQSQDMADQAGDSMRDRKTLPLVLGDSVARWTIATGIGFWSWFCPTFWHADLTSLGPVVSTALGTVVGGRYLLNRSEQEDKTSFKLYNIWVISLFLLPLSRDGAHT